MCDNFEQKLLQEIIRRNYHRKLSASIYHHAKNVRIIGILAYPKIILIFAYKKGINIKNMIFQ